MSELKVIFGKHNAESVQDRVTLLELDTFDQSGLAEPVTVYAVVDSAEMPQQEIPVLKNLVELHNTMMLEYRKQNWSYCEQALEHLTGKWNGMLDSFYQTFASRIQELKTSNLDPNWNGIINKTLTEH